MFAVVRTGGKQYKVASGDTLRVEKLEGEEGETITLSDVLMTSDGTKVTNGSGEVQAEIVRQMRTDKVIIFKKKRRQNYRRKAGHRQHVTEIKITDIK